MGLFDPLDEMVFSPGERMCPRCQGLGGWERDLDRGGTWYPCHGCKETGGVPDHPLPPPHTPTISPSGGQEDTL